MKQNKINNLRFELIGSSLKGYKEVQVIFSYKSRDYKYFVLVAEGKNVNYLNEGKKVFYKDLSEGKVLKSIKITPSTKSRPWLIATASILGAAAITFGLLYAFVHFAASNSDEPDVPSNYVSVVFNAGDNSVIEGTNDKIFKYYVRKGTSFAEVFKDLNYKTAYKQNEVFSCWTLDGSTISDDYLIENPVQFEARYVPIKEGCITITSTVGDADVAFSPNLNLRVSTNGTSWTDVTDETFIVKLNNPGDQVYVQRKINSALSISSSEIGICKGSKPHIVSGSIESLMNGDINIPDSAFTKCFFNDSKLVSASNLNLGNVVLSTRCFSSMFEQCSSLIKTPSLPAMSLTKDCYVGMFKGCSSLTSISQLPATDLNEYCYNAMFANCTSLVSIPKDLLSAENLARSCYYAMFENCTSLINAPNLDAEIMAYDCYRCMFKGCTSLVNVPDLKASVPFENCYESMFEGCTSLVNAPHIGIETLNFGCCKNMFKGCTSLVNVPDLKASSTTQPETNYYEYESMFEGCTSLVNAPNINIETLGGACCRNMFKGCTSLVNVPDLKPLVLHVNSYEGMFQGCTSLVKAPAINAETLAISCCVNMFEGCTSLTSAPLLKASTLEIKCYKEMFKNCSSLKVNENGTGTKIFTCPDVSFSADAVTDMFAGTVQSFGGTPTAGNTYNYY